MRRRRMLWQLFPSFVAVLALATAVVYLYTSQVSRGIHQRQAVEDLEMRARLIVPLITPHLMPLDTVAIDSISRALGQSSQTRITVVLPGGRVAGDSERDTDQMERHDSRPEVAEALAGRFGTAVRYSNTLQRELLYVAIPINLNGSVAAVVRTSVPEVDIKAQPGPISGSLTGDILIIGALLALLAAAVSWWIARSAAKPVEDLKDGADRFARGELRHTLPVTGYDEVAGLAQSMNQMAAQLHERIHTTVRQRTEQEAILTAMVEGVMAVDAAERILNLNAAAGRLFKVAPQAAIGRSVHEVVRNSELHRLVSKTLESETPVEGAIELTGNGERQLQVHGTTLRDSTGRPVGGVIVLNDITRLRRLENVRKEFVANVSHELRTPITSIKGFIETLQDGAIDRPEDARRFLEIISRQANQLNNIIEDLLALSRIEQGQDDGGIELSRQQVGRVLRAAVQNCEAQAGKKEISLVLEGEFDLVAPVNPNLLEQAVVNLLTNAITYSPPGSAIRVGACLADDSVRLYVSDEGPGIEPQHLDRIFERFYRIDKARSRQQGGTGLGLAIVKHIALAHRGQVSVESTVGKGSTFTIALPRT